MNGYLFDSGKSFSLTLTSYMDCFIVNIISLIHSLNIILRIKVGLGSIGFCRNADLRKPPALHQLIKELRYVLAVKSHLLIFNLIAKDNGPVGKHVQHSIEF